MLEPRGGLWSSGSVSDSQNKQGMEQPEKRSSSSSGCGSGRGGEVVVVR